MAKGQAMSLDLLLAITVFIIVMALLVFMLSLMVKSRVNEEVESESRFLPNAFNVNSNVSSSSKYGFLENNKVNPDMLYIVSNTSYKDLKSALGIKHDFCIYFVDNGGYLIRIDNKTGIGSPRAKINDIPCGDSKAP